MIGMWRYRDFRHSVSRKERFFRSGRSDEFLDYLIRTSSTRIVTVNSGQVFWRAQIGCNEVTVFQDGNQIIENYPFPPDRMKPLDGQASEGRANTSGIPVLYLATQKETAIMEVRPWIGSLVSIAQFGTAKNLKILDFSKETGEFADSLWIETPTDEDIEKAIWLDISNSFSKPVTREPAQTEYIPTQILSELFSSIGVDGIAYQSNFGEGGYNVALFDLDAANLMNCGLHSVKGISVETSDQSVNYFVNNKDAEVDK